jgi:DNA-binding transcriptional LysR family regulator
MRRGGLRCFRPSPLRSFIAAAAFLKTSQPALTRTIKRIEEVLGVSLFERTGLMRLKQ